MAGSSVPPSVAEFFRGRSVFITGATGFCGKVLVEKLLRSCPDIGTVYAMVRSKRGQSAADRLPAVFENELFDRLKQERPNALDKVVALTGDIMEMGLGMSQEDRKTLQENVTVVFHVAATVRFDDVLRNAVLMNIRGTREVLELALGMKDIKAFLHVSTTYCNTDREEIDEILYPAPADWKKMITAVETLDETLLACLAPKLLGMRPNTYTYTKAIGEHVVNDYADRLPVIIHRPSIVISTYVEPFSGWIDNFHGPVGLAVAIGTGIMRTSLSNTNNDTDYMAVDIATKTMILAAWQKGTKPDPKECVIYNCSSKVVQSMKNWEVLELGLKYGEEFPLRDVLWIPGHTPTTNVKLFYVLFILLHLVPAVCYDTVMRIFGGKPMLIKLQRRIFIANTALSYFLLREWTFYNSRFMGLDKCVLPEDRDDWCFDFSKGDAIQFLRDTLRGGQKYLLKEDPSWLPESRRKAKRMYWLDKGVKVAFVAGLARLFWTSGVLQNVCQNIYDIFIAVNS